MENGQWKPSDLSDALCHEWVRLTARRHVDLIPEHRLESALLLCDLLREHFGAEFDAYCAKTWRLIPGVH